MKKTKITAILAGGLLASTYSASAALSAVLAYDADGGTGSGTAGTLANGTSIVDQSVAGNDGVTANDVNGVAGSGSVATVEDDPNSVAGELSFSFDGSSARIVSTGNDLLTDDLIAAAGGYTMSTWIKTTLTAGTISVIGFAGTDGLNIVGGQLNVMDRRGNNRYVIPDVINDGAWHNITIAVDTSADLDGTTGSDSNTHNLIGSLSVTVDGVTSSDVSTITIGDFGDFLNRSTSVGGHSQAFPDTEFTGLLYNPTVYLGVVPEPSSTALLGLGGLALIMRRRK